MNLKRMVKKLFGGLESAYDWLYDDWLATAGKFIIELLTGVATLFYAITGMMPIVPQWAWAGMFLFMLAVGTMSLQDLINWGYDEDGNKIPEEEDDEIVED